MPPVEEKKKKGVLRSAIYDETSDDIEEGGKV